MRRGFGIFDLENELTEIFCRKVDLVFKKYLHRVRHDHVIAEAQELDAILWNFTVLGAACSQFSQDDLPGLITQLGHALPELS